MEPQSPTISYHLATDHSLDTKKSPGQATMDSGLGNSRSNSQSNIADGSYYPASTDPSQYTDNYSNNGSTHPSTVSTSGTSNDISGSAKKKKKKKKRQSLLPGADVNGLPLPIGTQPLRPAHDPEEEEENTPIGIASTAAHYNATANGNINRRSISIYDPDEDAPLALSASHGRRASIGQPIIDEDVPLAFSASANTSMANDPRRYSAGGTFYPHQGDDEDEDTPLALSPRATTPPIMMTMQRGLSSSTSSGVQQALPSSIPPVYDPEEDAPLAYKAATASIRSPIMAPESAYDPEENAPLAYASSPVTNGIRSPITTATFDPSEHTPLGLNLSQDRHSFGIATNAKYDEDEDTPIGLGSPTVVNPLSSSGYFTAKQEEEEEAPLAYTAAAAAIHAQSGTVNHDEDAPLVKSPVAAIHAQSGTVNHDEDAPLVASPKGNMNINTDHMPLAVTAGPISPLTSMPPAVENHQHHQHHLYQHGYDNNAAAAPYTSDYFTPNDAPMTDISTTSRVVDGSLPPLSDTSAPSEQSNSSRIPLAKSVANTNQKWSDVSVPTYHTSTTTNTLPDNAMSNTTVAAAAAAAATLATNNKNDNNDDDENDGTVLGNLVRRVSRRVSNKRHNQPSIAGAASSNSGSDGLHPHQHRGLEEGPGRQQSNGGYYDRHGGDINRNKSLVRPERNRVAYDPRSPQYRMANRPEATAVANTNRGQVMAPQLPPVDDNNGDDRHGPSRGNTIQRRNNNNTTRDDKSNNANKKKRTCPTCWVLFSRIITFYAPRPVLRCFGMRNAEVQQAWREKMALVTIIFILCLAVGFLTFGFQQVVCFNSARRVPGGNIPSASAVIHGKMYDLRRYRHPLVTGITDGDITGDPVNAGGKDLSLRFQLLNSNCADVLRARDGQGDPSGAPYAYFPCQDVDPYSSVDPSQTARSGCHLTGSSRRDLRSLRLVGDVFYTWDQVANRKTNYVIYNSQVLDLDRIGWFLNSVDVPAELVALQQDRSARGRDITLRMSTTERRRKIARCMVDTLKIGSVDTNSIGCIASDIVLYVSLVVIVGVVIIKFFLAVLFSWVLSWRLGAVRKESMEERYRRIEAIEQWSEDIHSQQYGGGAGGANTASTPTGTFSRPKPQRNSLLPSYSRFSTRPVSTSVVTGADEATFGAAPMPGGHRVHSSNTMVTYPEQQQLQQQQPGSRSFLNIPANSGTNLDSRHTSANGSPHGSGPPSPRLAPSSHHGTENSRSRLSMVAPHQLPTGMDPTLAAAALTDSPYDFPLAYTILLVTCYSEGEEGLRTTLDSLANTDYPQSHKLILVICDGIITGAGNTKSTPDICLSMMKDFIIPPEQVQAHSYVAIADGTKRHNMAKVYAGYYDFNNGNANAPIVPMVTIVKCGAPAEASQPKPGNRGKRDSQIILMGFLQRVMFDERMTELEYEFFNAIWTVVGVPPDRFEIVLMVDADTKVYPDSLTRMVACMMRDPSVMGLCGETKIANKKQSWVTMIQVFEYYISHHMSKAFESVFGGVTCLPGCFCMYRIKAPKGPNGFYVPILANPDIVENYSENVVDTLHKKNLLLLGEDRFLTTLMLRTFPKRKMMFVPQAVCKTIVPDEFKVLLSQRRRWINSTVHNLLELVLIRDLCGTFCFSMQFVIFMELIGTVVLPAAITFTIYLIIISFFTDPVPIIPLLLLAAILGLPAVLILMTTRKIVYVMWMLIYLASLPLWNFILPVYAFWHFDDFSWGQTRMVEGEAKGKAHGGKEGEFDSSQITMKRWCEFEREKRRRTMAILASGGVNNYRHSSIAPTNSVASSSYQLNASKPSLNEIGYTAPSTTSVLGLDQIPGRNSSRGSLLAQPPSAPFMYDDGWDRHSNRSGNSDGTGTPGTPGTATGSLSGYRRSNLGYSSAGGGGGTSSSFGEDHQPLSSSLPR